MALTKKDTPFILSPTYKRSFEKLKRDFISTLVLYHFNPENKIVVKTDPSNLVVTRILSQYDKDILHPLAHFTKEHSPAEINYEIYNKELLTIICAFKEWRPLLEGSPHNIKVTLD
jgi:hypothetical protein